MFYTFGMRTGLETLVTLSKPHAKTAICDEDSLKKAYLNFLKNYQPSVPTPSQRPDSQGLGSNTLGNQAPEFVRDIGQIETLAGYFAVKSALNDKNQSSVIEPIGAESLERIELLEKNFAELKTMAPDFVALFELFINYVFCATSKVAGGGTTSSALGVIWSAHRGNWSKHDVFEFFVHEMTHNMVFLDECRFKHYASYPKLALKKNYAQSAILSIERPLDKVMHSLAVAAEILQFRTKVIGFPKNPGLHPKTTVLLEKAEACLESVRSKANLDELLTDRGLQLIEAFAQKIAAVRKVADDARVGEMENEDDSDKIGFLPKP